MTEKRTPIFFLAKQLIIGKGDGSNIGNASFTLRLLSVRWNTSLHTSSLPASDPPDSISNEYIPELWQFIQLIFSQKHSRPGNSGILCSYGDQPSPLGVNAHRSEFTEIEISISFSNSYLPKNKGPFGVKGNPNTENKQEWQQDH
jgi:hypothetical protein